MITFNENHFAMSIALKLITIRKKMRLTQPQMADLLGIHVNSIKKYETKQTRPSIDVLKKMATALHVTTDSLLFEEHEREPKGGFALQLEAIKEMPDNEQLVVREVLESLIIKSQSRRWDTTRQAAN